MNPWNTCVRALLLGLFEGPPASPEIRAELTRLGLVELRAELERVDPIAATKIEKNDEKRIVRALEVYRLTGEPMSAHQARHDHRTLPRRYDARMVGLSPELMRRGWTPARARHGEGSMALTESYVKGPTTPAVRVVPRSPSGPQRLTRSVSNRR